MDAETNEPLTPEPAATTSVRTEQTVAYHPVRGAMYGLLLGLGVAIYLVIFKIITIQLVIPIIAVVVCIALGAAWGRFTPPVTKT